LKTANATILPVVAIEKSNEKARPTSSGKRFTSPGRKKKGR
ncbi:hypothetical protein SeGA_5666, partial [Salmonella enterica subsp. enterica serovar Gaminara str. A4-567]